MKTHDARFDRLVDDELSEQERRELLTGLDDEPGGWRRCALAFLESQCWRQTLGAVVRDSTGSDALLPLRKAPAPQWRGVVKTLLAMAASFLVAFWVGSFVQQTRVPRFTAPVGTTGEVATTVGGRRLPIEPGPRVAPASTPDASPASPWRMVTVSAPAGAAATGPAFSLPAVERDGIDQQWLRSLPPAMPDDVLRAFNRTGHEVKQHRELVPLPLQDGRQVVVPVDQVDVHYVGSEAY